MKLRVVQINNLLSILYFFYTVISCGIHYTDILQSLEEIVSAVQAKILGDVSPKVSSIFEHSNTEAQTFFLELSF